MVQAWNPRNLGGRGQKFKAGLNFGRLTRRKNLPKGKAGAEWNKMVLSGASFGILHLTSPYQLPRALATKSGGLSPFPRTHMAKEITNSDQMA